MRDLYEVQGIIPPHILGTIYTDAKPLNQHIIQENEIGHVDNSCEDVEFKSGPDLELIKQMLNMVKQTSASADSVSYSADSVFEISKVNCQYDASVTIRNNIDHKNLIVPKVRKMRNVALVSILEAISEKNNTFESSVRGTPENELPLKLLRPEDFIKKSEAKDKILEAVPSTANTTKAKINSIIFKNNAEVSDVTEGNSKTEVKQFGSYKPSLMADLYYRKYLERSRLKESMHNNLTHESKKIINIKELEAVSLPQHRHLLTDDCVVCKVFCKKYVK
ncbi:unnamed protein product, partial [Iphiclides podalirius]